MSEAPDPWKIPASIERGVGSVEVSIDKCCALSVSVYLIQLVEVISIKVAGCDICTYLL